MAKFDHHVHTARHSPDSIIEPEELIEEAIAAGLDGVVITEHDHQWSREELAELQARSGGLIVLSGAEISTRQGHFLVYGLPDLDEAYAGINVVDLLKVVRKHEAAIVAAHPFRWDQDFRSIVDECGGTVFDGLELVSNNVTPETRRLTESLLASFPMGRTGSSDGHDPEIVGCYFTEFPGEIRTISEFVRAVRSGLGCPGHTAGRAMMSGEIS